MSETQAAMREFRFLDDKRKSNGLTEAEEYRWYELANLLGIDIAALAQQEAQPQGYWGADGQWYQLTAEEAAAWQAQYQAWYAAQQQAAADAANYPPGYAPPGYHAGYPPQPGYYPPQSPYYDPATGYPYPAAPVDPHTGYVYPPTYSYPPQQPYYPPQAAWPASPQQQWPAEPAAEPSWQHNEPEVPPAAEATPVTAAPVAPASGLSLPRAPVSQPLPGAPSTALPRAALPKAPATLFGNTALPRAPVSQPLPGAATAQLQTELPATLLSPISPTAAPPAPQPLPVADVSVDDVTELSDADVEPVLSRHTPPPVVSDPVADLRSALSMAEDFDLQVPHEAMADDVLPASPTTAPAVEAVPASAAADLLEATPQATPAWIEPESPLISAALVEPLQAAPASSESPSPVNAAHHEQPQPAFPPGEAVFDEASRPSFVELEPIVEQSAVPSEPPLAADFPPATFPEAAQTLDEAAQPSFVELEPMVEQPVVASEPPLTAAFAPATSPEAAQTFDEAAQPSFVEFDAAHGDATTAETTATLASPVEPRVEPAPLDSPTEAPTTSQVPTEAEPVDSSFDTQPHQVPTADASPAAHEEVAIPASTALAFEEVTTTGSATATTTELEFPAMGATDFLQPQAVEAVAESAALAAADPFDVADTNPSLPVISSPTPTPSELVAFGSIPTPAPSKLYNLADPALRPTPLPMRLETVAAQPTPVPVVHFTSPERPARNDPYAGYRGSSPSGQQLQPEEPAGNAFDALAIQPTSPVTASEWPEPAAVESATPNAPGWLSEPAPEPPAVLSHEVRAVPAQEGSVTAPHEQAPAWSGAPTDTVELASAADFITSSASGPVLDLIEPDPSGPFEVDSGTLASLANGVSDGPAIEDMVAPVELARGVDFINTELQSTGEAWTPTQQPVELPIEAELEPESDIIEGELIASVEPELPASAAAYLQPPPPPPPSVPPPPVAPPIQRQVAMPVAMPELAPAPPPAPEPERTAAVNRAGTPAPMALQDVLASGPTVPMVFSGDHSVILHTTEGQVKRGKLRQPDLSHEVISLELPNGAEPIALRRIKAIFFLLQPGMRAPEPTGAKVRVTFKDGRQVAGFSLDHSAPAPGFFLVQADNRTNTARVFIYRHAVQHVKLE